MLKTARSEALAPLPEVIQTAISSFLPTTNFRFIIQDALVEPIVEDLGTRPFSAAEKGWTAYLVELVKTVVMRHVNANVLLTHLSKIWVLSAYADSDKRVREGEGKWSGLLETGTHTHTHTHTHTLHQHNTLTTQHTNPFVC